MSPRRSGVIVFSLATLLVAPSLRAQAPPAATAGPPVRGSWTSDRLALREGDIVTILIDEYTVASADKGDVATRDRGRDISVGVNASGTSAGGTLRTGNDVSNRTRGEASRRDRFSAELSARVAEVLPGGVLRIEATRKLRIDDHEQEVVIRGFVRPQDVSASNTVDSWRIADAEILYDSNDKLGKVGGIWSTILDLIIP
ncbi:MAG: flagellar basal body L-ring protein FlgH [Longimicrobiales bacterium]